jgi:hypothetical protein
VSNPVRTCALLTVLSACALLAGCSGDNPVVAEGNIVTGGLTAGGEGQVAAALALSSTAVKGWQVENGALPSAADFAAIPGATSNGGATVTYRATASGFCLTGTSSGQPTVTRVWIEPGGLQPAGTTC